MPECNLTYLSLFILLYADDMVILTKAFRTKGASEALYKNTKNNNIIIKKIIIKKQTNKQTNKNKRKQTNIHHDGINIKESKYIHLIVLITNTFIII